MKRNKHSRKRQQRTGSPTRKVKERIESRNKQASSRTFTDLDELIGAWTPEKEKSRTHDELQADIKEAHSYLPDDYDPDGIDREIYLINSPDLLDVHTARQLYAAGLMNRQDAYGESDLEQRIAEAKAERKDTKES